MPSYGHMFRRQECYPLEAPRTSWREIWREWKYCRQRMKEPKKCCICFYFFSLLPHQAGMDGETWTLYLCVLSHVLFLATVWIVACLALLSRGFFRQEYWSGLSFPTSGDLPDPGIKPKSPALQVNSLPLSHPGSPCICSSHKIEP